MLFKSLHLGLLLVLLISIPNFQISAQLRKQTVEYLDRMYINGNFDYNPGIIPTNTFELKRYSNFLQKETQSYEGTDNKLLSEIRHSKTSRGFNFFKISEKTEFVFFSYSDSIFILKIDPLLLFNSSFGNGKVWTHRKNGLSLSGEINDFFFFLKFYDNLLTGNNSIQRRRFSSEKGINPLNIKETEVEYDAVDASVGYSWNWGNILVGKNNPVWGSGERSQLIFSDKAPSYPLVQLEITPAKWFSFRYFHGWLHSGIIDSNTVRYTLVDNRNSFQHIPKYIAAHMISVRPSDNLLVNIGESIIYSERIEPLYLIPVMFFRVADHYQQDNVSNTGNNAQLFADISYRMPQLKMKAYTTLFVDEFSTKYFTEGNNAVNIFAYTVGIKKLDVLLPDNYFTIEYTRAKPFLYMNSNDANLFTNHTDYLGDYLGGNGDALYVNFNQHVTYGLDFSIWTEYFRKGAKERPEQQYSLPYPEFLFGERSELHNLGVNINYTFLEKIRLQVEYIRRLKSTNRFQNEYYFTERSLFSMAITYGF